MRVTHHLHMLGATAVALAALATGTAAAKNRPPAADPPRAEVPVFVLEKGTFKMFDPPGEQANELVDVNSRGQVAGTDIGADGTNRGFLRDKRGRITLFEYPGATRTFVNKINSRGEIVGNAYDADTCELECRRAYLRDAKGRFTEIRVPGAVSTQAVGLDDRGRVVGDYVDSTGGIHGYVWEKGRFRTIDGPDGTGATLTGINDRGQIVGVYQPAGAAGLHGFLLDKGTYQTIEVPKAASILPLDINGRGQIVGFTTDVLPVPGATDLHGFVLWQGPRGRLTRIDVPGAPATLASGIDDRGRIAGLYLNPNAAPSARSSRAMSMPPLDGLTVPRAQRRETP